MKDEAGTKPEEFTVEDDDRRLKLISEGWPDWNKKDFFMFIKMAEQFGRNPASFESYREGLPQKSAVEIREYSSAFWKNYNQIENWQKYIDRINKGEQEIDRRNQVVQVIEMKFNQIT